MLCNIQLRYYSKYYFKEGWKNIQLLWSHFKSSFTFLWKWFW